MLERIDIKVAIQREDPVAPRYVVVPSKVIALWELERTTEVDIEVNGRRGGRRRLRRWEDGRWYIQFPQALCDELALDTGRMVTVSIKLAVHDLPGELVEVLGGAPEARARWDNLAGSEQHKLREHVAGAQTPVTRWERAASALGVNEPVPPHVIAQSKARVRQPLSVEIHAPPDGPESRKALDAALDVAARIMTEIVLYDSWKEVAIAHGIDPSDKSKVPPRVLEMWEAEYEKGSHRKKPGPPARKTL